MKKIKHFMRTGMLYMATLLLVGTTPMPALAEEPPETFTYNADTNHWDSNKWRWDEATSTYIPVTPPQPKAVPVEEKVPAEVPTVENQTLSVGNPGPGSNSGASSTAAGTNSEDVKGNVKVDNIVGSIAKTGDAKVDHNHTAGNATSGDAAADTTLINTLHSSVQGDTEGISRFTADIYGNVNGDITLYPAIASAKANSSKTLDGTLNVDNKSEINNDVTLSATSGNADVDSNTKAGSATTGNAHTVANVVNLINSIIAANKSFIGTINIHGNLNGDILISPEFIPQLLASNGGSASSTSSDKLTANLDNNQTIINNIKLAADSGKATVDGNTSAGNAKTGNAQTNLTVLNLTGRKVIAKNSILVFVNVLGKWVGVIANAPTGSTAALLGNEVTGNEIANRTINANNDSKITNNIDLASRTGDATVGNNTEAGDATSGDASASANILNIDTSTFSLSDWFGVVFINVFGTWVGCFGMDTESGNMVQVKQTEAGPLVAPAVSFGFVPHDPPTPASVSSIKPLLTSVVQTDNSVPEAVTEAKATLASSKVSTSDPVAKSPITSTRPQQLSLPFMIIAGTLAGVPVIGLAVLLRRWLGIF